MYAILAGRGYADATTLLGEDFAGVIVRDGWARYRHFTKAIHQTCLAHLLRRARELQSDHPRAAFVTAVKQILQHALALRDRALAGHVSAHGLAVARASLGAAIAALVVVPLWILASDRLRRGLDSMAAVPPAVRTGIAPLPLFAIALAVVYALARRRPGASRFEAIQAVFTFLVVGLVILTTAGALFRGQGMALVWPW